MSNPYKPLEKALGYRFRKKRLLEKALTHRSFRYEEEEIQVDNQRLEYLGDAALGLIAAAHLFETYRDLEEGELTRHRSQITSSKALARIARKIDLGTYIRLGRGEQQTGGRERSSNLTDAMEAVLGAAYLDGGLKAAIRIFDRLFVPELGIITSDKWSDNPKGELQEFCQKQWKNSPRYRLVDEVGPAHSRVFTVVAIVNGEDVGHGTGTNKRAAEMEAAKKALASVRAQEGHEHRPEGG